MEGDYPEAAALVYQLVEDFPEDPSARLLCGHIYCYGLEQYEVAREQYTVVLGLSDDFSSRAQYYSQHDPRNPI